MEKVVVIALIHNTFPEIVSSMILQTHKHWELVLIHDGKNTTGLGKYIEAINDKRIKYIETNERLQQWGHPWRKWALEQIKAGKIAKDAEYVVITNADNYHVPVYLEYLISGFKTGIIATYCSKFVHAYKSHQIQPDGTDVVHQWGVIEGKMQLGYVDCACVMVRKEAACEVGWRDMKIYSDWTYFTDLMTKYGKEAFAKVYGCLVVHN